MNWKLIFTLSLFGLAMAVATISWIPMNVEPVCWLVIFVICAVLIAINAPGKYFLHGFLVSMVNSVWITAAHAWFFATYISNHPKMLEIGRHMPLADHPRRAMLITGPLFGAASGVVLGLFAFIASKLMKPPRNSSAVKPA